MRRWLMAFTGFACVAGVVAPVGRAGADDRQRFSVEPVAGPPGTSITVKGNCTSSWGGFGVQLRRPVRDGQIHPIDTVFVVPDFSGNFTATLTNTLPADEQDRTDPVDLEIITYCNPEHGGDYTASFASTRHASSSQPTVITSLGPGQCAPPGFDSPCPAHFRGFTPSGQLARLNSYLYNFENTFSRGGSIAVGDVNGDSQPEYASGVRGGYTLWSAKPGTGFAATVSFNGGGFGPQPPGGFYDGGVNVAFGDVDGDGRDELIQAADVGGGPRIIVNKIRELSPNGPICADCSDPALASFFAYDPAFHGGVTVAAADVDGDGTDEIITGAGVGGGSHVRFFEGTGTPMGVGFFAYDPSFRGGISVAAANVTGDGKPEVVTAPRGGGGPHVRVLSLDGVPIGAGFYAYDAAFGGGVAVATGAAVLGGYAEIVTVPFSDAPAHVRIFTSVAGDALGPGFFAFQPTPSGARVAVVPN